MRSLLLALLFLALARPAMARDVFFTASDGARLHYSETGPPDAPILVFVPGWTMPGWIFDRQQRAFDEKYQVVLFDPRGQGSSEITPTGYDQDRRGADIGELLDRLPGKVVRRRLVARRAGHAGLYPSGVARAGRAGADR